MSQSTDQSSDQYRDRATDQCGESVDLILRTNERTNELRTNHLTLEKRFDLRNAHEQKPHPAPPGLHAQVAAALNAPACDRQPARTSDLPETLVETSIGVTCDSCRGLIPKGTRYVRWTASPKSEHSSGSWRALRVHRQGECLNGY